MHKWDAHWGPRSAGGRCMMGYQGVMTSHRTMGTWVVVNLWLNYGGGWIITSNNRDNDGESMVDDG